MDLQNRFESYLPPENLKGSPEERSADYLKFMNRRRSLRFFSDRGVSKEVIDNLILKEGKRRRRRSCGSVICWDVLRVTQVR